MLVAPLLQRFVVDELARASALAEQARSDAVETLLRQIVPAPGAADAQARRDAAAALQERGPALSTGFRAALAGLVQSDLAATGQPAALATQAQGLALMDETVVEADIEISRAAMQIDSAVEWEQRELQTFTSALRGEAHVGEGSNPIRPALVARALWQASDILALAPPARIQALRALAAAIGEPLKRSLAAACTRLESQGVTPSQYRTVVAAPGGELDTALVASRRLADGAPPGAGSGALRALLGALPTVPPSRAATPPSAPSAAPLGPQVTAGPRVDTRLVELIARLYDTLLADAGLVRPARDAVARLQASTLRVALRDASLLDGREHPTWRLLDRIGGACCEAAAAGPARLAAMAARCDRLADELARHTAPDAALYRQGLARLEALVAEDLREAQRGAAGAIGALQRTERRRQVQAQIRQRLDEQFVRRPVGPATRHWLRGASALQIADAMIEDGPDSAATSALTRIVDDLLWSLHPPSHPASRQRLVKLLPGLIGRLRTAMAQGGVSPAEQRAVLAELEASHSAVLWPKTGPSEETPEEIVRRLREEVVEADDIGPRRDFGNSVLDLSTLDTVPASLMPAASGAAEDGDLAERGRRAEAAVAALTPGRAARLLLQGHWHDAQLLWRSADAELLLFADAAGLTHALTRRALERLHVEGLARLDAPPSYVQRAIDALLASQPAQR